AATYTAPSQVAQVHTGHDTAYDARHRLDGTLRPRDHSRPAQGRADQAGAEPPRYPVEPRADDPRSHGPRATLHVDPFAADDVPAHDQLLSAIDELHLCAVRVAVLRVENLATGPFVPVAPHVTQDLHADNGLTPSLPLTLATCAVLARGGREERSDDSHVLAS